MSTLKLESCVQSIVSGRDKLNQGSLYPLYGSTGVIGLSDTYTYSGDYVLVARVGANAGRVSKVSGKFNVTDNTLVITLKDNTLRDYIYYSLEQVNFKKLTFGTGQPLITGKILKSLPIRDRSFEEQLSLSSFLSTVDTKISQLTEKHRLLKEYKKGVMQQIFSQKMRLKDDGKAFPDWKTEAIGKYLEPYKELVPASTDLPVLTSSRTGLYIQERSVINEGEYGVLPLGYFTYRHMSDDLVFKFNVNRDYERGAVSKEYPVFKTIGMDTYFLETKLNEGHEFKRFAIQQKQGGTRTRLYFKNLKKLKLSLPCLSEQQKITQFLQSIDKKIDSITEQIEQTKQFKKGLLQQMFV
ncbi:restriction endonuclease subunit S [Vibrio splendidus]|uniref:restriction endonuclease subunit S n=1 Tax=Vibrio splendidus TaxID=29497 RepID=UPI000D39255E|nr:restriction endonuclease subunit S [Vibrio splendidus]PTO78447.1 hypothetical protein CWN93_19425 [Vibrio splendidus]